MNWQLITDSDLSHLAVSQRFFAYARAYLDAATKLCDEMLNQSAYGTWPHATVVLMLSAHSTELFLKGALQNRFKPDEIENHSIQGLAEKYWSVFTDSKYKWDIPFSADYAEISAIEEIKRQKEKEPLPSVRYRYPIAKNLIEWPGIEGFEPHLFSAELKNIRSAFERLEPLFN